MSVLEARRALLSDAGLGEDGGYGARWVRVETRPFAVYFPNTARRVEAAKRHDLHHIATGYGVDWVGEAEIAAWELAGGCGGYGWAWLLDAGALAIGLIIAPRRTLRAMQKGRKSRNLYHTGFPEGCLASTSVGELRERLGLRSAGDAGEK